MATTKTINTRIKNRFDTLTNWQKDGVELLAGEIALVSVTTQQIDAATGNIVNVPAVLMKVGENDAEGKPKAFSALPWLSAKAADVYGWAKNEYAKDVPVKVVTGKDLETGADTYTEYTLGAWLKTVYEASNTNAAGVSANATAIQTLNKGDNDAGSVANTAIAKVTAALNVLNLTDEQATGEGTFVKTVTQTNGQIAVVKAKIAKEDLPELTTGMIKTGDATYVTLDTLLGHMNSEIAGFTGKLSTEDSGDGTYVKGVAYNNGKFTITKGNIALADIPAVDADHIQADAVVTAKIKDSNVTTEKIADSAITDAKIETVSASKVVVTAQNGETPAVMLPAELGRLEGLIAGINTAIAGGVHFIGTTTTDVTTEANKTSDSVTIDSKAVTANTGDIVIYGTREFIWTGSVWEELGDVTRIGALENKISNLDYSEVVDGAATNSKFVTSITQADGKIAATYARPEAADVLYAAGGTETVKDKIDANAAAIATKADAGHGHSEYENQNAFSNIKVGDTTVAADSATDTVEFAGTNVTITADADNDKITFAVADGTTSEKGIVKLNDTYTGNVAEDGSDSTTAATTKAVKLAYAAATAAQAGESAIKGNYVRVDKLDNKDTLVWAEGDAVSTIIFDCGGAGI